jgi:hypothetical protein
MNTDTDSTPSRGGQELRQAGLEKSRRRRLAFLPRKDREILLRAQKKLDRLRKERAA